LLLLLHCCHCCIVAFSAFLLLLLHYCHHCIAAVALLSLLLPECCSCLVIFTESLSFFLVFPSLGWHCCCVDGVPGQIFLLDWCYCWLNVTPASAVTTSSPGPHHCLMNFLLKQNYSYLYVIPGLKLLLFWHCCFILSMLSHGWLFYVNIVVWLMLLMVEILSRHCQCFDVITFISFNINNITK
jgi:hypothetical protein